MKTLQSWASLNSLWPPREAGPLLSQTCPPASLSLSPSETHVARFKARFLWGFFPDGKDLLVFNLYVKLLLCQLSYLLAPEKVGLGTPWAQEVPPAAEHARLRGSGRFLLLGHRRGPLTGLRVLMAGGLGGLGRQTEPTPCEQPALKDASRSALLRLTLWVGDTVWPEQFLGVSASLVCPTHSFSAWILV